MRGTTEAAWTLNTPSRLLLSAVLVVGIWGVRPLIRSTGTLAEVRPPNRDLRELPTRLGPWIGQDAPDSTEIPVDDGTDVKSVRVYRDAAGNVISLYIGVWRERRYSVKHPPENCYRASGYQLIGWEDITLPLSSREAILVRLLSWDRNGERLRVLYWYQRGEETLLYNRLRPRAAWAFRSEGVWPPLVKVMLQSAESDPEEAERQLKSIAGPIYAWTRNL